jgi:hypothetical protein
MKMKGTNMKKMNKATANTNCAENQINQAIFCK